MRLRIAQRITPEQKAIRPVISMISRNLLSRDYVVGLVANVDNEWFQILPLHSSCYNGKLTGGTLSGPSHRPSNAGARRFIFARETVV